MNEKTYQTPCGTIHYWINRVDASKATLVFLPGLTADHRLFDQQIAAFEGRYSLFGSSFIKDKFPKRTIYF